jgi:plastocyanin
MWKFWSAIAVAASLAGVPAAGAATGAISATVTISITKNGFAPSPASASTADTVQFTNSDAVAHQVVFKTTSGVTCSPSPFALQPAQSGTCTFSSVGTFSYSDPDAAGTTFQGTLNVTAPAPPETISLFADRQSATYATKVTLTGQLSSKKAGEHVVVLATPCGRSEATKAATLQTVSGGEYTIGLRTSRTTVYTVQVGATKSDPLSVEVSPRLRLGRIGAHRYSLRVFAAQKFAGRYATFQRYDPSRGRWVFVKRVLLRSNATNILPTVISSVAFRSAIAPRVRIRAVLPQSQVGSCYLPGASNVIRA